MIPFRTSAFFLFAANSSAQRLRDVSAWLKICGRAAWPAARRREGEHVSGCACAASSAARPVPGGWGDVSSTLK